MKDKNRDWVDRFYHIQYAIDILKMNSRISDFLNLDYILKKIILYFWR